MESIAPTSRLSVRPRGAEVRTALGGFQAQVGSVAILDAADEAKFQWGARGRGASSGHTFDFFRIFYEKQ